MRAVRIKLGVRVAELGGLFLVTFGRLSVEDDLPTGMVLHQKNKRLSKSEIVRIITKTVNSSSTTKCVDVPH